MNINTEEYNNSILKNIEETIKQLIKNIKQDNVKQQINTLKVIKAELIRENEKIYSNKEYKLNQQQETKIITKIIQQHEDNIIKCQQNNRNELIEIEQQEINIIKQLLPKQPTKQEIINYIIKVIDNYIITQNQQNYKLTLKDLGQIVPKVKQKYPNTNGNIIKDVLINYESSSKN